VVELSWVTYPKNSFFRWSYCNGVTYPGEKHEDISKWWKIQRFFKVVRNAEIFQSSLVVMGKLPRWKTRRFFKEVTNVKIFLKMWEMRKFLKMVTCNGQPTQMEDEKSFQRGLIVMGDLPRWNEMSWRDEMIGLEGAIFKRWKLKGEFERDRTRRGRRAKKRTR